MAISWNRQKYKKLSDHSQNLIAGSRRIGDELRGIHRAIQENEIHLRRVQQGVFTQEQVYILEKQIKALGLERAQRQKEAEEHQAKSTRVAALKNECEAWLRSKKIEIPD